jgi:hypothetical protein
MLKHEEADILHVLGQEWMWKTHAWTVYVSNHTDKSSYMTCGICCSEKCLIISRILVNFECCFTLKFTSIEIPCAFWITEKSCMANKYVLHSQIIRSELRPDSPNLLIGFSYFSYLAWRLPQSFLPRPFPFLLHLISSLLNMLCSWHSDI